MPLKREYDGNNAAVSPEDDQMTTLSLHSFGESDDDNHGVTIQIIENMKEEYGMFVWPCSVVLAEYVWQQRSRFSGTSVTELGAGTSLPGLVAAKAGANVTLTDDSRRVEVLENIRRVCDLNKLSCKVKGLTWGIWDAQIFDLHPQILLGADVLYDTSAFDDLFSTVAFLLQSTPGSVFITTYHNRSGHHLIEFLMVKWGLKCIKLLDAFSFMPSDKASGLSGNIQLAEIVSISQQGKLFLTYMSCQIWIFHVLHEYIILLDGSLCYSDVFLQRRLIINCFHLCCGVVVFKIPQIKCCCHCLIQQSWAKADNSKQMN